MIGVEGPTDAVIDAPEGSAAFTPQASAAVGALEGRGCRRRESSRPVGDSAVPASLALRQRRGERTRRVRDNQGGSKADRALT
jgi:hypothetical protein